MSTTHEALAGSAPVGDGTFPEPAPAQAASGVKAWVDRNRIPLIALVAATGVIGGSAAAWVSTHQNAPTRSTTASTSIDLPADLAGLPTLGQDPLRGPAWTPKVHQAIGDAPWGARSYGSGGTGKAIRVVVARTDLTGKLEQTWAGPAESQIGAVSCTHDTRLTPGSKARFRPTVLVCWRTTSTLSAYALIIDSHAKAPTSSTDGVAAVNAAWKAAGGTD